LLPPDGQANTCDCEKTQALIYKSHVTCYTQSDNSICDLSKSDWTLIFNAAGGVKGLVTAKGGKQMLDVAKICFPIVADATIKAIIKNVIDLLQ
jgi:hypothetical protein